MRFVTLTSRQAKKYVKPCPSCKKKLLDGEVVLALQIDDVSFNARQLGIHARCIQQALATAPAGADDPESLFHDLRERMVESGSAFPT